MSENKKNDKKPQIKEGGLQSQTRPDRKEKPTNPAQSGSGSNKSGKK